MAINYAQLQLFTVAGAGSDIGDVTLTLTNFNDIDGVALTMAAFGTKGFATLEPSSGTSEEQISFTGITPGSGTNVILTGVAHVNFLTPYTETPGMTKPHAGGVRMAISNTSGFYGTFANKNNNETIIGLYTFPNDGNTPCLGSSYVAPTLAKQIASKGYVDAVAIAGAPNADTVTKGIVQIATGAQLAAGTATGSTGASVVPNGGSFKNTSAGAGDANKVPVLDAAGALDQTFLAGARTWSGVQSFTADNCQITTDANSGNDAVRSSFLDSKIATVISTNIPQGAISGTSGEAITAGNGIYVKASDGKLYKTVGTSDEGTFSFVGIALTTVAGADLAVTYAPPGHTVTGLAGLTAGSFYFVTDTAGTLSTTPGTRFARVAIAISATALQVVTPKYRVVGTITLSAVSNGSTTVTSVPFYPAKLSFKFSGVTGLDQVGVGNSWGVSDDAGVLSLGSNVGFPDRSSNAAGYVYATRTSTDIWNGAVTARTATNFTITNTRTAGIGTLTLYMQYIAESL